MTDSPSELSNSQSAGMERLDVLMVERGLAPSRSKAQRLIRGGAVSLEGHASPKASTLLERNAHITVDEGEGYVSRGAYKLVGAFERFARYGLEDPKGVDCLDVGASTGGFCDVLLRRGAKRVIALDVGHGQLDPRIAHDPRISEMSGVNIRDVTLGSLPFRPSMVVSDVSFISLTYVIPVIAGLIAPGGDVVLLVKPQFEVGKGRLGKHGVVTDPRLRAEALERVCDCAQKSGLRVVATSASPIEGTHGNIEYLLYAVRP